MGAQGIVQGPARAAGIPVLRFQQIDGWWGACRATTFETLKKGGVSFVRQASRLEGVHL